MVTFRSSHHLSTNQRTDAVCQSTNCPTFRPIRAEKWFNDRSPEGDIKRERAWIDRMIAVMIIILTVTPPTWLGEIMFAKRSNWILITVLLFSSHYWYCLTLATDSAWLMSERQYQKIPNTEYFIWNTTAASRAIMSTWFPVKPTGEFLCSLTLSADRIRPCASCV